MAKLRRGLENRVFVVHVETHRRKLIIKSNQIKLLKYPEKSHSELFASNTRLIVQTITPWSTSSRS